MGKNIGFISQFNLLTSNSTFLYEYPGKLSALWNDEIVLQFDKHVHNYVLHEISLNENWSYDTVEAITELHVPIEKYLDLSESSFLIGNMNSEDIEPLAVDVAIQSYKDKLGEQFDENNPLHGSRALKVAGGYTNSIKVWQNLNSKIPCTFLPNYYEGLLINQLNQFNSQNTESSLVKADAIEIAIPNLKEYSWDEIVELRNHQYFYNFREKMHNFTESCREKNIELSREILDEILREDMEKMIQIMKPAPMTKLVKCILGNAPLSFSPINPLGLFTGLEDVQTDRKVAKDYGWVYFMTDVNGKN